MRNYTKINSERLASHSQCFLNVEPSGLIVRDSLLRMDVVGYETWIFEYFGGHLQMQMLYPHKGQPVTSDIGRQRRSAIETRCARSSEDIFRTAKHEAGHAILCYALRLCPVYCITVESRIIPVGNFSRLMQGWAQFSLRHSRGSTSLDLNSPDALNSGSIETLKLACQYLGGIAGCRGDETGAMDDTLRFRDLVCSLPELACMSENELNETVRGLQAEFQVLVGEIIDDPEITCRHEILAETVYESGCLNRAEIEAIVAPSTLPDYSHRIVDSAEECLIFLNEQEQESGRVVPKPGGYTVFATAVLDDSPLF